MCVKPAHESTQQLLNRYPAVISEMLYKGTKYNGVFQSPVLSPGAATATPCQALEMSTSISDMCCECLGQCKGIAVVELSQPKDIAAMPKTFGDKHRKIKF